MQDANALPKDLSACHALIGEQTAVIGELAGRVDEMAAQSATYQRQIEELQLTIRKLLEGNRREKFIDPNQRLLGFPDDPELQEALWEAQSEASQIIETITYQRRQRRQKKERSERFPEHLRREYVDVEVPEALRLCLEHGPRTIIRHDEVETLKYRRPELWVEVKRYPIMACDGQPACGLTSPERATGLCEGSRYDAGVGVAIVNNKFGYHLPYYRQQDIFAGSGWTPSRSTLDNIVNEMDFVLEPLADYLRAQTLTDEAIGIDDTHVKLLMPKEIPQVSSDDAKACRLAEKMVEAREKGEASLSAKMWVYSGLMNCPYNVFDFRVSRHRDGPADVLSNFGGYVMADCYSGNLSVILSADSRMTRMACWSHARRHMYEARVNYEKETSLPLALMRQLYDIERRAVDYSASSRHEIRQRESVRILDRLREWLDGPIAADALPKSNLGGAVNYLRNHWEALRVYTGDGRLPIDNNSVEQLMKQIATGRKNWIFVGSVRAGERNARLMSLVSSAYRHDLDVEQYLADVMCQILSGSTDYHSLLPDVWKATHPAAIREYRVDERRDRADRSRFDGAVRRLRISPTA
jgi:transposase